MANGKSNAYSKLSNARPARNTESAPRRRNEYGEFNNRWNEYIAVKYSSSRLIFAVAGETHGYKYSTCTAFFMLFIVDVVFHASLNTEWIFP